MGINSVLAVYNVPKMKVGCRRLPTLDSSTTKNFKFCHSPLKYLLCWYFWW